MAGETTTSHAGSCAGQLAGRERSASCGMLQHQRALQIFVRMETAGEAKMALQIRSGFAENLHDGFRHEIHYSKPPGVPAPSASALTLFLPAPLPKA